MGALQLPNYPPPRGIRVPAAEMRRLTADLLDRAGMPRERAGWLAARLVECDLRCVFSHGTKHAAHYVRLMRDGRVNPAPEVRVVDESETTAVLDGDGGLGYFPCHRGMEMAVARARAHGLGAVTTGNHHHIGSAGLYSRMALEADCIGLAASSVRYPMDPEDLVLRAAGASPLSVAVPAGTQPPLVVDMGAHMLPHEPELLERFPRVFFKSLGLGAVLQVLGGVLAGIHRPELQAPGSPWVSDQGGFVAAIAVERFMPAGRIQGRHRRIRGPGAPHAALPGRGPRRAARRPGMAMGAGPRPRRHPRRPRAPGNAGGDRRRGRGGHAFRPLRKHPLLNPGGTMKITDVDIIPIRPRLAERNRRDPVRFAGIDHRVVCRVRTDDGLVGYGDHRGGAPSAASVEPLIGRSPFEFIGNGFDPAVGGALYDVMGKHLGVPAYRLMGPQGEGRGLGGGVDAAGVAGGLRRRGRARGASRGTW